jgi:hypothetical protein
VCARIPYSSAASLKAGTKHSSRVVMKLEREVNLICITAKSQRISMKRHLETNGSSHSLVWYFLIYKKSRVTTHIIDVTAYGIRMAYVSEKSMMGKTRLLMNDIPGGGGVSI